MPFVPGTGSAKLDETLELTAAARDAGADAALVITPYYARPTQEGAVPVVRDGRRRVPRPADPDLQRPLADRGRRRARDRGAPAPRPRQHRRDQGDDQGLRALLPRAAGVWSRLVVWSGIELLGLPLLALGGAGFVSAVANLAPAAVARMFERGRPATSPPRGTSTSGCTRWSTCCSSRPTRRRSSGCSPEPAASTHRWSAPRSPHPAPAGVRRISTSCSVAGAPMFERATGSTWWSSSSTPNETHCFEAAATTSSEVLMHTLPRRCDHVWSLLGLCELAEGREKWR